MGGPGVPWILGYEGEGGLEGAKGLRPAPDSLETPAVTMPCLMPAKLVIPLEMPSRPHPNSPSPRNHTIQSPDNSKKPKLPSPSNPSPTSHPNSSKPPISSNPPPQTRLFTYPFAPLPRINPSIHSTQNPPRIDRVQRSAATPPLKFASPLFFLAHCRPPQACVASGG